MARGPVLLAALIVTAAIVSPAQGADRVPTLIRDGPAARFKLPSPNPTAPEADYVQPDTQIEPSIAVNPNNPDNVVATYQEGRIDSGGDYTNGYATTFDGGKTWEYGEVPGLTNKPGQGGELDRGSDAVVAFGPKNTVYINSLVFDSETGGGMRSGMTVNVSKDGGRTWSAPVLFQDDNIGGTNDKNWIVVDNQEGSGHTLGRVYVVWDRIAPIVYDYCDHDCDQQANWLPNLQTVSGLVFPGQGLGAYPVVTKDGGLGMAITTIAGGIPTSPFNTDQPEQPDKEPGGDEEDWLIAPAAGSTPWPGPLVFTPPIEIGPNRSAGQPAQRGPDGIPSAAADTKSGKVYVVWDDERFRSDDTNDIVFTSSDDNGATWAPLTRVNPGPKDDHVDHYGASIAVGEDGTIHVGYRVRNENAMPPDFSPYIDSYYQQSKDGGKTWSEPLKIDLQPSHARYGAFSRGGTFEGDYDQIATAGGSTYFVRCQGWPAFPGEPIALTNAGAGLQLEDAGRGHQHQQCWVALVRDEVPGATATVPQPTPGFGQPLPTGKALKLRLIRRRFPGHRLRVSVAGANGKVIKRVRFYVGKKRVAVDKKAPFVKIIRVVRKHRTLKLRAIVELRDGRKVSLVRSLTRRKRG